MFRQQKISRARIFMSLSSARAHTRAKAQLSARAINPAAMLYWLFRSRDGCVVPILSRGILELLPAALDHDVRSGVEFADRRRLLEIADGACEVARAPCGETGFICRDPIRRSHLTGHAEQFINPQTTGAAIHREPVEFPHHDTVAGEAPCLRADDDG